MFILTGFHIEFSWFSFFTALVYSCIGIISTFCSINALKTANLSVYSMFNMLGGMLLPFLYGVLFYNEVLTIGKIFCCILIAAALFLTLDKFSCKAKAFKYYIACFILNGLVGMISKFHQSNTAEAVNSQSFMCMINAIAFCLSTGALVIYTKKLPKTGIKESMFSAGFALCNGIGNLFLLIALKHVPASVQYPFVTGGVIVFSAFVAYLQKEKLKARNIFAVILAFLSTVLIML